jgi:hypothetical protein
MVKMTVASVASSGLGTITLGSASSGYRSFATAYGANATVDIRIEEGTAWEVCEACTYTHSGTTVTRGTRISSSTGSAVAFTSAATVSVVLTAAKGNLLEQSLDLGLTHISSPSSGTTSLTTGDQKIGSFLSQVLLNPNSWWDSTTDYRFEPNRAGVYLVIAGGQFDGASVLMQASFQKNGAIEAYGSINSGSALLPTVETVVRMNGTTDYLEFFMYSSGSITSVAGTGRIFFKAVYLGP